MVKLAEDTVNDITIFKTFHSGAPYHVRYGLQVEEWSTRSSDNPRNLASDRRRKMKPEVKCWAHLVMCHGFTVEVARKICGEAKC